MKIQHIKITNVLGIDSLEFSPEGFTTVTGPNGAGKSSLLEAIKSVVSTGHDATLLRKGADKGEVVLVLDDGTEIQERITPSGTTRNVAQGGKKVTKPGEAIKALTDVLSVNPVEFLTARKQDRVKVLLESMPITLDTARLQKITGVPLNPNQTGHALTVIGMVRQQVFEDRTVTNRVIKEKESTINQLRIALPDAPGGVEGSEDELRAQVEQAQTTMRAEHERIDTKLTGVRQTSADKITALRADAQAKIDAIKAELETAIQTERDALADTETKAARVRQKATDTCTAALQPLQAAINAIVANRDAAAKRQATLETIKQMEQERSDLLQDAERQTMALAGIDAYKLELLGSLPIPNVEVIDGEVYRDGIPFDRLNTAQRVGIAFDLAKLRAGKLRMVCLDGMELLDEDSLAELQRQAEADDMQVFITRVQGKEFAVETK